MSYTVCPQCHFHEPSTTACSRCGTVFAQWYPQHSPPPVREPEDVLAEALKRLERERTTGSRRWQRRGQIVAITFTALLVIAVIIACIRLVRLYSSLH